MRQVFFRKISFSRSRTVALSAFLAPVVAAVFLVAMPASGQQFPNINPQQLLQQFGAQDQNDSNQALQNNGQSVVLQPAVPPLNTAVIRPSRLETIMSSRAGVRLEQFGYDQLGRGSQVVVPQTGAVQDDYILGAGDEIVVVFRGQENTQARTLVDRNGQIVVPRLAPVAAAGRSLGSVRDDIQSAVRRSYVATEATISVSRIRQISVSVTGEVNVPGQRLVPGLASAADALLLSGGIRKSGSLRNVRILRGGRQLPLDLYSLITPSSGNASMRLVDGDRIIVPPLGQTVAVAGLVRRPGIYELPQRQNSISVRALIDLAGGEEVRGRYRFSVLRIGADGRSAMTALNGDVGTVGESEILFLQLGADQSVGQATLSGGTPLAGAYSVTTAVRLSEMLKQPGALGPNPYTPFGLIIRRDPLTLSRTLQAFTPAAVLAGREDMALQTDDTVRIFSVDETRILSYVVQTYLSKLFDAQSAIRNPLGQITDESKTVGATLNARANTNVSEIDVAVVPADIQRREVTALLATPMPGSNLDRDQQERRAQLALAQAQRQQAQTQGPTQNRQDPTEQQLQALQRSPEVVAGAAALASGARQSAGNNSNNGEGNNNNNGGIAEREVARNFIEQTETRDLVPSNREIETLGQLSRQLGMDPLVLINFLVEQRARVGGAVRGAGYYFVGSSVTLSELVQAAGGINNWADESGVERITTVMDPATGRSVTARQSLPLRQGQLASYIVKPRDEFRFAQVTSDVGLGQVTLQGHVRNPGTFTLVRGERLSDLLMRAGGLTSTAYPTGTVFLRASAAQAERESYERAANELQNQLVMAMTRVGAARLEPATFSAMQSFVQELRNQRAVGRISIVSDPSILAANRELDPLLESGDVIFIPQRPVTVAVLGQVLQPGSYPYRSGETVADYIERAGGYSSLADSSLTFIVLPDGSARRVEKRWLSFSVDTLPPGSAIVVPRDVSPLDLRQTLIDISQIFSQFAVAIASVAVLSAQ